MRSIPPPEFNSPSHASLSSRYNSGSSLPGALKLFFELRDRKYLNIVEDLFRLYEFPDIAQGIYRKYRTLPIGWKQELTRLKQEHYSAGLDWLDLSTVKWYSETTDTYPGVDKKLYFPSRGLNEEAEKVVDEFIENEQKYFEKLQAFMKCYVSEVEAIVDNKIGPRAKSALGLDKAQVRYVFGTHLVGVYRAVERLLISLEALTIVPAMPKTPGGRPGHLADVLTVEGRNLVNSYAPYNARYQTAKRLLETQSQNLVDVEETFSENEIMRHLNFRELWQEISQSKSELKNLGIDSVLIMPIRRFPNYKLFVDRLRKTLDQNHPAYPKVEECLKTVDRYTREIDDAVRQKGDEEENNLRNLLNSGY